MKKKNRQKRFKHVAVEISVFWIWISGLGVVGQTMIYPAEIAGTELQHPTITMFKLEFGVEVSQSLT